MIKIQLIAAPAILLSRGHTFRGLLTNLSNLVEVRSAGSSELNDALGRDFSAFMS
jgi:hypothetical protein